MANLQGELIEVEERLFEELDKFSDKFPSLINLIFITAGFSITILTFSFDKNHDTIQNVINNPDIYFCFGFLVIAFLASVLIMFTTTGASRLVKKENSIRFRDPDEQVKNNKKLYTLIEAQRVFYILATGLVALSLPALFNYFGKNNFISSSLPLTYEVMIAFSIILGLYYIYQYFN